MNERLDDFRDAIERFIIFDLRIWKIKRLVKKMKHEIKMRTNPFYRNVEYPLQQELTRRVAAAYDDVILNGNKSKYWSDESEFVPDK